MKGEKKIFVGRIYIIMYMSWQIALVFNIIFATIRAYIDKKLVAKIDPFVMFFYVVSWGGIILLFLYFLRHQSFPAFYPQMIFLGVLYTFAMLGYLSAIKINLSQSVVFASYNILISMILAAIFLSEWRLFDIREALGQKTVAGVFLAFLSLALILKSRSRKEEKIERHWLYFISTYVIIVGLGTFLSKAFLGNHGPLETLISQLVAGPPLLLAFALFSGRKLSLSFSNHILIVVDSLIMILAVTFFFLTLQQGPITLVLPIQSLAVTILIALVGLFLYQETHLFTKEKLIGLVVGIIGVGLLVI